LRENFLERKVERGALVNIYWEKTEIEREVERERESVCDQKKILQLGTSRECWLGTTS
jgi:hypothetical protein